MRRAICSRARTRTSYAAAEGKLVKFLVKPGDKLLPGDPVAELYDPQLENEFSAVAGQPPRGRSQAEPIQPLAQRSALPISRRSCNWASRRTLAPGGDRQHARRTISGRSKSGTTRRRARPRLLPGADRPVQRPTQAGRSRPRWTVLNDDRARENLRRPHRGL